MFSKENKQIKEEYNSRIKKIIDNHYIFYANNKDDLKMCIGHLFYEYFIFLEEYDKLNYPCNVFIYTYYEFEEYEKYYESRIYIEDLSIFLNKINDTISQIIKQRRGSKC